MRCHAQRVLLILLAGTLLGLSLPAYNAEWLGWMAVAPLLLAVIDQKPLPAIGQGMLAAAVCAAFHTGWSADSNTISLVLTPFVGIAFVLGLTSAATSFFRRRLVGIPWITATAAAGVSAEWLTSLTPLPVNLAVCEYQSHFILQIASLTGVWGISFIVWWMGAAIADFAARRSARDLIIALVVFAAVNLLGFGLLSSCDRVRQPQVRVAAIQAHDPGETAAVITPAPGAVDPDREALTQLPAAREAQLVVWSEECLSAFLPNPRVNPAIIAARAGHLYLVTGFRQEARPLPFNAAALVDPAGNLRGIYRKIHLFGGERLSVQPGREVDVYPTRLGRIGMEICFDNCYPDVTRRLARAGARIIAMPNYDPPTPHGTLHLLHAALMPFRAVENRVPLIRADDNGCSEIVSATGKIVSEAPLWTSAAVVANIIPGDGFGTLYTRWGDWFAYLCAALTAALLLINRSHCDDSDPSAQPGGMETRGVGT